MHTEKAINDALTRFQEVREQARKFHPKELGRDVNARKCFADFLVRIANYDAAGLEKVYGAVRNKTAMSVSQGGTTGGYLVPTELSMGLMQSVAERAVIRPRTFVQPMNSATLDLPLPDATTAQAAGKAPYFGGIQMLWTTEAQTENETEPAYRLVELRAHDLSGYALASNNQLADAPGVEAFLYQLFRDACAYYEDYAFIQGTGAGQPKGFLNAEGAISVTRGGANAFSVVDAGKMSTALLPRSWERAIWLMHPTVWNQIAAFANGAWQFNQPIREGPGAPHFVLNGQEGYVTDKVPVLGTKGDVMLVDPGFYVLGDRQAVEIDASTHIKFQQQQTAFRIIERVDGQPWFSKPITATDGSTQVSPYVILN